MVQDTYRMVQMFGRTAEGGNNSRVSVAHHASLNFSDAFTVCARVYIDPDDKAMQGYDRGLICKSDGTGAGGGFYFEYADFAPFNRCLAMVIFYNAGANAATAYTANTIRERGWYHAVATFDRTLGANNIQVFQNGVRVATANLAIAMDTNVINVLIGSITTTNWMFKGYYAEANIYNRALTEAEINYNYLHPNNPIRRGLVCHLPQHTINTPAAGTWLDVSPQRGNNGTITNCTVSTYPEIKSRCNALQYITLADTVNCGNAASVRDIQYPTFEAWVKPDKSMFSNYNTFLIAKRGAADGHGLELRSTGLGSGQFMFSLMIGGVWSVLQSPHSITPQEGDRIWHVVGTYDGTNMRLYENGVRWNIANIVGTADFIAGYSVLVGMIYRGLIYGTRIYNRALSDAEVFYNFQHPSQPIRRGCVLNLTQESLYGSYWYDLSGSGNNGTITGAVARRIGSISGR